MKIQYYGWSGVTLEHCNTLIGFDLFGDAVTSQAFQEDQPSILCLTHGHPEHAGSLKELLEAPQMRAYLKNIHLASSEDVVKHINRNHVLAPDNVHVLHDGETAMIAGVQISAFTWVHMPLLPPKFSDKLEYVFQLMIHPIDLIRIGLLGLSLPMNAPQLGFHITYPDGNTVLNYSEGVHRLTNAQEVEAVSRRLPADVLMFAVEPDDAQIIPRWVEMLAPKKAYLYEAHRPWRDVFHLPFIDVQAYAAELAERFPEMRFHALTESEQVLITE